MSLSRLCVYVFGVSLATWIVVRGSKHPRLPAVRLCACREIFSQGANSKQAVFESCVSRLTGKRARNSDDDEPDFSQQASQVYLKKISLPCLPRVMSILSRRFPTSKCGGLEFICRGLCLEASAAVILQSVTHVLMNTPMCYILAVAEYREADWRR